LCNKHPSPALEYFKKCCEGIPEEVNNSSVERSSFTVNQIKINADQNITTFYKYDCFPRLDGTKLRNISVEGFEPHKLAAAVVSNNEVRGTCI
jgi:hypothetical protein